MPYAEDELDPGPPLEDEEEVELLEEELPGSPLLLELPPLPLLPVGGWATWPGSRRGG